MNERELLIEGLERCAPDYPPQAVDNLLSFSERLREANLHMNLTAITEPNEIVTRHFLDCAVLAPMLTQGARAVSYTHLRPQSHTSGAFCQDRIGRR